MYRLFTLTRARGVALACALIAAVAIAACGSPSLGPEQLERYAKLGAGTRFGA